MTTGGILSASGFQPTGLPALWGNSYWLKLKLVPNLPIVVLQGFFYHKKAQHEDRSAVSFRVTSA
jgi:hypothetical protein